ncbi:MAG: hypothetical protein QJR13_09515, partial [Bacillota bacterium]|nr:hypothetical protein [Bacillota bacterium]
AEQGSSPHVLAHTRSYGAGPLDWSPALPGHPRGWLVWVRFNAQSQQHELHFWDAAWPNDSGYQPVVVPLPSELVGAAEQVVMLRWSPDGSRLAISKAATPPYFALRVVEVSYNPQGNPPWSIGPFKAVVRDTW